MTAIYLKINNATIIVNERQFFILTIRIILISYIDESLALNCRAFLRDRKEIVLANNKMYIEKVKLSQFSLNRRTPYFDESPATNNSKLYISLAENNINIFNLLRFCSINVHKPKIIQYSFF